MGVGPSARFRCQERLREDRSDYGILKSKVTVGKCENSDRGHFTILSKDLPAPQVADEGEPTMGAQVKRILFVCSKLFRSVPGSGQHLCFSGSNRLFSGHSISKSGVRATPRLPCISTRQKRKVFFEELRNPLFGFEALEERGPNPDQSRSFFDRHFEVPRHAHRQLCQLNAELFPTPLQLIAEVSKLGEGRPR